MSAAFRALVADGDRWLEEAVETYRGGGSFTCATACAAIATAYYGRAELEKPGAFDTLLERVAEQQQQAVQRRAGPTAGDIGEAEARAASMRRHPAGRNRAPATNEEGSDDNDQG